MVWLSTLVKMLPTGLHTHAHLIAKYRVRLIGYQVIHSTNIIRINLTLHLVANFIITSRHQNIKIIIIIEKKVSLCGDQ